MLDEFDKIQVGIESGVTSPQVPDNLRELFHSEPRVSAILSGSQLMKRLRREYFSPLFGLAHAAIPIGALDLKSAQHLVTRPAKGILVFSDAARDRIVDLCACQPFLIQHICGQVFDICSKENTQSVTVEYVERAAEEYLRREQHFFEVWRDDVQDPRRQYLLCVIGELEKLGTSATFDLLRDTLEERLLSGDKALADHLDFLVDLTVVAREDRDGQKIYRIAVPLLSRWVAAKDASQYLARAVRERRGTLVTIPRYQVLGGGTPTLLGRSSEVADIRRNWRNTHVSVIGPKFYGKTVLLRHMQGLAKPDGFSDVVYWDLRHPVPESEDQFYSLLQKHLREESPAVREHLPPDGSTAVASDAVYDAFETIQEDNKTVLVIMQSMDQMLLRGDTINPNLWDDLAALAELSSVRFLISSRRKLIELVPSQRAKLSDFWRRMGKVCPLGLFNEADIDALLAPLSDRKIRLENGARTEFLNWSGGIPPLAIGLCEILEKHKDGVTITKTDVDSAAAAINTRYLDELWASIPADVRDAYSDLAKNRERSATMFSVAIREEFQTRGLASLQDNQLKTTSRMLDRYALSQVSTQPALTILFSEPNDYLSNVRKLLELRVVHVAAFEPEIKSHFDAILQQLDQPDAAIKMLFGVYDRCADLIIREDFPDDEIPKDWVEDWEKRQRINPKNPKDEDILDRRVPKRRGPRMELLNLLRDDDVAGSSNARPSTLCLLDNLLEASNYARHAYEVGEKIPLSFACAAIFSALELCGQLAEDLK